MVEDLRGATAFVDGRERLYLRGPEGGSRIVHFVEEIALTDGQLARHAKDLFRHAPVFDIHLKSDGKRLDALPALPDLQHVLLARSTTIEGMRQKAAVRTRQRAYTKVRKARTARKLVE